MSFELVFVHLVVALARECPLGELLAIAGRLAELEPAGGARKRERLLRVVVHALEDPAGRLAYARPLVPVLTRGLAPLGDYNAIRDFLRREFPAWPASKLADRSADLTAVACVSAHHVAAVLRRRYPAWSTADVAAHARELYEYARRIDETR